MAAVRAIRGATTLDEDSPEHLFERVQALVKEMLRQNHVAPDELISMIFTATDDIGSAYPATAARALGLGDVPLLGAREITVKGDLARCIRVLAHVDTELARRDVRHVYLEGARELRPDLAG